MYDEPCKLIAELTVSNTRKVDKIITADVLHYFVLPYKLSFACLTKVFIVNATDLTLTAFYY